MAKRKKQKRRVFELRWDSHPKAWALWERAGAKIYWGSYSPKSLAIACAASWVRACAPSQLVVKTKRSTISFERTYGADPKRSVG